MRGWRYYFLDTVWFLLSFRGGGVGTASDTVTSNYNVSHDRNYCPLSRELHPAHDGHEAGCEGVGRYKRCFCGLVLNNNLSSALFGCHNGEM